MVDFQPSYIKSLKFLTYDEETKKNLCVKRISNFSTYDDVGVPISSGLSDPYMGSSDPNEICRTCSLNGFDCPGHFGIISLSLPVYNPSKRLEYNYIKWSSSFGEHKFLPSQHEDILIKKINKFYHNSIKTLSKSVTVIMDNTRTILDERQNLIKNFMRTVYLDASQKKCSNCSMPISRLKHEFSAMITVRLLGNKNGLENINPLNMDNSSIKLDEKYMNSVQHLTASDVMHHFKIFYHNEIKFLNALLQRSESESLVNIFFLESIAVIPPKFRPVAELGDSKFENPTTGAYKKIILNEILLQQTLLELRDTNSTQSRKANNYKGVRKKDLYQLFSRNSTKFEKIQAVWSSLQTSVNVLFDNKLSRNLKEDNLGLRQLLEKKEGLFRMHMMGKRVNQAARSVISPDPMLDIDEVGIPHVFATKLTYPEHLNPINSQNLITYVSNGPKCHPGATHVEFGRSKVILHPSNSQRNNAVCKRIMSEEFSDKNVIVRRHLLNGDIVLMNRQPTLHRPSIMGHRVRVLPKGRTIRLHYANCKSYNADFDGDEMNAHFPQNELARSEGYYISSCSFQYLSPRDGKPLTGLIQDYMVAGMIMTMRDRFLNRNQYQKIIYSALVDNDRLIVCLPPAIQRPVSLWTGKQIVSSLLINCTPMNQDYLNMQGKSKITEKLWTDSQPCSDPYLSEDSILIRSGELLIGIFDKNQLGSSSYGLIHVFNEIYGGYYANKLLSVLGRACIALLQYTGFSMGVDDIVCQKESLEIREKLIEESRESEVRLMNTVFGKDGNFSNLRDIYKNAHLTRREDILIDLDNQGKNMSNEFQNKINKVCSAGALFKKFPSNSLQMMIQSGSKGTPVNAMQISGLLGQIELEGCRPPLMISGRTLPCYKPYSCSLQSGGFVESSFLSALKPSEYFFHCMAGREGLVDTAVKTSRSGYLQRCLIKHMEGIKVAYDYSARDSDGSIIQFLYGEDGCDTCALQFAQDNKFEIFSMNKNQLNHYLNPECAMKHIIEKEGWSYQEQMIKILTNPNYDPKLSTKTPLNLPVTAVYNPAHYLGSVSEKYYQMLLNFTKNEEGNSVVSGKYPSVLSGQSVGEPSTQMTLNTFHFAGRGEMNVTLGIPRLRELFLVGGDNIKTPSISIDIKPSASAFEEAKKLSSKLNPIPLSKLLSSFDVAMEYDAASNTKFFKQKCRICLNFISKSQLKKFNVRIKVLDDFIQNTFVKKLAVEISKKSRLRSPVLTVSKDINFVEKVTNEDSDQDDDPKIAVEKKKDESSDSEFSSSEDSIASQEEDSSC
ncbi:hypothetical protein HZS_2747 [Henneguya salminicola]|nr:hypothetical protein HZS_2747 [Henneguya salminicola]